MSILVGALLSVLPTGPVFATGEFRDALYQSIVDGYYSKAFELTGGLPPRGQAEAAAECVADLMLATFSPDEMATLDTAARTKGKMPAELGSKYMDRYHEVMGEMATATTCLPIAVPDSAND
jgi:hypothetical protein